MLLSAKSERAIINIKGRHFIFERAILYREYTEWRNKFGRTSVRNISKLDRQQA